MCPIAPTTDVLTVRLIRSQTLPDIEEELRRIYKSGVKQVDVWMARDLGPQFFKDTRIVSLLAAATHLGVRVRVIDWAKDPDGGLDEKTRDRFGTTLEGIASLEYADAIVDSQKVDILNRLGDLRRFVSDKDGVRTPEKTSGRSLTFCAFDPEDPIPVGFAGLKGKAAFMREFLRYRRDYFEIGSGEGFSDRIPKHIDDELASFAYELWQNGFQHGRLDELNKDIRGLRYIRVQKHVAQATSELVDRAAGFSELQEYLEREARGPGPFKFYEVSIADSGLGICDRFLATRPEFNSGSRADFSAVEVINRIINEALTSKLSQSGAGHGLERAIRAVHRVRGFVSLRSGSSWLYQSINQGAATVNGLQMLEVQHHSDLPSVGTLFNLIFPLHSL